VRGFRGFGVLLPAVFGVRHGARCVPGRGAGCDGVGIREAGTLWAVYGRVCVGVFVCEVR